MALPVRLTHFALEQVPSFSTFLPYLAYDEENSLYLLTKNAGVTNMAWGFAFECLPHPGPGASQATALKGIYDLPWPPGSTIQVNALGLMTETFPLLREYVKLRQPGIYRAMGRTRVEALAAKLSVGQNALQVAPLRDVTLLVSVTVPITPAHQLTLGSLKRFLLSGIGLAPTPTITQITEDVPAINRLRTTVHQLLKQGNLFPTDLSPQRLLTLLFPILNPGHPYTTYESCEPDRELRRQLVAADTQIIQLKDEAIVDGHHVRSITPLRFPQEMTIDRMATLIGDLYNTNQQIPTSFLLTLNSVMYDRADVARSFQRKHAITSQQAFGPMARLIPRLAMKKDHYDIAAHALEHGHTQVSAFLNLLVWAPGVEEVNQGIAAAETLWRMHNFAPQRDGPVTLNLLKESLPMSLSSDPVYLQRDLARAKTILNSNAASLCPVGGDWKGTGRPIVLLVSRRGQPCGIDLFNNPTGNFNCVIAGKSGGGKSFFTNDLLLGLLGTGAQVWIIDKGKSYEKLVKTLKGDYLLFTAGAPICLNPFSAIEPHEFEEWLPSLKALVSQMAEPVRTLTSYEDSVIGQAVQEAYAAEGRGTTITLIAEKLREKNDDRCQDLAQMLYPYTRNGEYGRFFEGPATINLLRSPLLLLELEELSTKPSLQSVVFLNLVLSVQAAMQDGDRAIRKVLAIDEAWQFLRSPQAAAFVVEIYRRFRKYNGAAITITQEINDMLTIEAGASILANSDMRILFPHKSEGLTDPRVNLSPYELALMRSLTKVSGQYSELYVKHPTGSGVYRHIVDPYAYWLYTTDADEVARLQMLQEQGMSMHEAVRHLAGHKGDGSAANDAELTPEDNGAFSMSNARAPKGEGRTSTMSPLAEILGSTASS